MLKYNLEKTIKKNKVKKRTNNQKRGGMQESKGTYL